MLSPRHIPARSPRPRARLLCAQSDGRMPPVGEMTNKTDDDCRSNAHFGSGCATSSARPVPKWALASRSIFVGRRCPHVRIRPVAVEGDAADQWALVAQDTDGVSRPEETLLGQTVLGPRMFLDHIRQSHRRCHTSVSGTAFKTQTYRRHGSYEQLIRVHGLLLIFQFLKL